MECKDVLRRAIYAACFFFYFGAAHIKRRCCHIQENGEMKINSNNEHMLDAIYEHLEHWQELRCILAVMYSGKKLAPQRCSIPSMLHLRPCGFPMSPHWWMTAALVGS